MSFTTIHLQATYLNNATPCVGQVTVVASAAMQDTSNNNVEPPISVTVGLDNTGSISIPVIATDDSTTQPTGVTYLITEQIRGSAQRSYSIAVPHASPGGNLNLATAAPVMNTPVYTYVLVGQAAPINQAWQPLTPYVVGELAVNAGTLYECATAHTSGASFSGTNWTTIGGAGAVSSVFGRTGAVVATSGDYTAAQVGADAAGLAAAVQTNLTAEATTRGTADTTNANAISTETTRATNAEALLVPLTATNVVFLNNYGGDPTGATFSDTALAAARTAGGAVHQVVLGIGTYKFAGNYTFVRNQSIIGMGSALTKVNYTGSGPWVSQNDTAAWNSFSSIAGAISGMTVNGTSTAGQIGAEYGDILGINNLDLVFQNFLGAGSIGYYGKNVSGWAEHGIHQVRCFNCTDAFIWDTLSFDWSVWDLYANIFSGTAGNVLTLRNGAQVIAKALYLDANCGTIAGNTGWLLAIDPGGAGVGTSFLKGNISIAAETDGTVGTGHIPLVIGGSATSQFGGAGVFEGTVGAGGIKWGASTLQSPAQLSFGGRINFNEVTPFLGQMSAADSQVTWGPTAKRVVDHTAAGNLAGAMFLNSADVHIYPLGTTCTPSISAGISTTTPTQKSWDIYFKCNHTGGCSVTWSSMPGGTPLFAGNTPPTLSTVIGQVDHLTFTWQPTVGKFLVEVISLGGTGPFTALTGDATSTSTGGATTVTGLNGTSLAALATGIVKNTTATGVPSIAAAADIPTVAAGSTGPLSATDATTTNARTPTSHASTHGQGGADPLATVPSAATGTTQAALDASTKISTTAYADAAVAVETTARSTSVTARSLIPTAVKTANYTAAAGDFVMCDATSAPFTVTAPALVAGVRWGARLTTSVANAVTLSTGSGTFDTNGTASLVMASGPGTQFVDVTFAANAAGTQWVGTTSGKPNAYLGTLFQAGPLTGDVTTSVGAGAATLTSAIAKVSGLTAIGHSWATVSGIPATDQARTTYLSRLMGMLGVNDDNLLNLCVGGSFLTNVAGAFAGEGLSGWAGVLQFVQPPESAAIAESSWVQTTAAQTPGFAAVIGHGVNDVGKDALSWPTQGISAWKASLTTILSRLRAGNWWGYTSPQGTLVLDSTVAVSGFAATAGVTANSGAGTGVAGTNGNTFTITLPALFQGGTIGVCCIAPIGAYGVLAGGGIASSGLGTITLTSATEFASVAGQFPVLVDTEQILCTFATGTTLTMVARGFNGTTAAAHTAGASVASAANVKVNWSGTAAAATGSTTLGGQGYGGWPLAVTTRFACTPADAGKTIIGTVAGIVTASGTPSSSDTSSKVGFDSYWLEAAVPPPIAILNLPRFNYSNGNGTLPNYTNYASLNAATAAVVATFDSTVQVADIDSLLYNRSAITTASMTNVATTFNATVQPGFPLTGGNRITVFAPGDASAEDMLISSSTPPVLVSGSTYTFTVTRAYNGTTAVAHGASANVSDGHWMYTDNIHPSPYGQAIIADVAYQALAAATPTATKYLASASQGNYSKGSTKPGLAPADGFWHYPAITATSAAGPTMNAVYATPIYIERACLLTGLAVSVVAAAGAGGVFRFGLWTPDTTGVFPNTLIGDFGTVITTSIGLQSLSGVYKVLRPGWYWVGGSAQVNVTSLTLGTIAANGLSWPSLPSSTAIVTSGASHQLQGYSGSLATGALASTFGAVNGIGGGALPVVGMLLRTKNWA